MLFAISTIRGDIIGWIILYLRRILKNTMRAIWGDSNISSSNKEGEEDITNLCLMANDNEAHLENPFEFIFNKLFEAFNNLINEYRKIRLKNKELKKFNLFLAEEKNKIMIKKRSFEKKENIS